MRILISLTCCQEYSTPRIFDGNLLGGEENAVKNVLHWILFNFFVFTLGNQCFENRWAYVH